MRVLIVGCGYVGLPLGAALAGSGHEVFGLRRNPAAGPALHAAGIQPLFGDVARPADLARLPGPFDWIVSCAASSGGMVDDYRRVYLEGARNLIAWLKPRPPGKFVYTSSTGVYAQNDGSLVTEESPTEPAAETARILVEAEKTLLAAAQQGTLPAVILRLAGIYGPERGYWLRQFLSDEARLEGAGERWLNMIHRDDVVGCLIAALERARPGEIYNAVDDEPVSQLSLFQWLADRLGRPLPPSVPAATAARKRGVTNKRVCNRKLKADLAYRFLYPSFREGFAAELLRQGAG